MLSSFRVFGELVFFDLGIPDYQTGIRILVSGSGFRYRIPDSGFLILGLPLG